MTSLILALFLLIVSPHWSSGKAFYRELIPNGERIPNPCNATQIWHGVGHLRALGAGPTNKFGDDFAKADHRWTVELCQTDSDNDGRTNGQELGDPQCTWRVGDKSPEGDDVMLSHPGICDVSRDVCGDRFNQC